MTPSGERCTATTASGRCPSRYLFGRRPILCARHHAVLRRSLATTGALPVAWTEMRPRAWSPELDAGAELRFLISPDGEPVAIPRGGGHFVGVDSLEIYDRAICVVRPQMSWLRRLAVDRPDVERALRRAAEVEIGREVAP